MQAPQKAEKFREVIGSLGHDCMYGCWACKGAFNSVQACNCLLVSLATAPSLPASRIHLATLSPTPRLVWLAVADGDLVLCRTAKHLVSSLALPCRVSHACDEPLKLCRSKTG